MGESCARGNFGAGHTFDKAQDQRLAIGFRKRTDGVEGGAGFGGGVGVLRSGEFRGWRSFFGMRLVVQRNVGLETAMKVCGAVASDGGQPSWKVVGVAQGDELRQGLEENVLDEVFDLVRRDACEKDAVDHTGIAGIEGAISGPVAVLGGANQGRVWRGGEVEPCIHGCDACVR